MKITMLLSLLIVITSCAHRPEMKVNKNNIKPGSTVAIQGKKLKLHKGKLSEGDNLANIIKKTNDEMLAPKVTIVSIVPSIDTKVCEEQTHILGETSIHPNVNLVTISRDLPMAQNRFANEAKLTNIQYISDYKDASFGKRTGLLIKDNALLTRGVLVLDKTGKIVYMQFVDEITELPNMNKAIKLANKLAK